MFNIQIKIRNHVFIMDHSKCKQQFRYIYQFVMKRLELCISSISYNVLDIVVNIANDKSKDKGPIKNAFNLLVIWVAVPLPATSCSRSNTILVFGHRSSLPWGHCHRKYIQSLISSSSHRCILCHLLRPLRQFLGIFRIA